MALGIVIFGDPMPTWPGQVLLLAAGVAALIAGVILVARGPALSAGCIAEPAPAAHRTPPIGRGDTAPTNGQAADGAARVQTRTQQPR
jgi:hypothetical protein